MVITPISTAERERFTQQLAVYSRNNADYYTAQSEAQITNLAFFEDNQGNLRKALEMAQQHKRPQIFVRIVLAMQPFLQARGRYAEATQYLELALGMSSDRGSDRGSDRKISPAQRIQLIQALGTVLERQAQYPEAIRYLQQGIRLARQHQQATAQADMLNVLGSALQLSGHNPQALRVLQHSQRLAEANSHMPALAQSLSTQAAVYTQTGRMDDASAVVQRGLAIAQEMRDERLQAQLLNSLSGIEGRRGGDMYTIEGYLRRGLALAARIGNSYQTVQLSWNLGNALYYLQQSQAAVRTLKEALSLSRSIGSLNLTCGVLVSLGVFVSSPQYDNTVTVVNDVNNADEAAAYWKEALEIARAIGQMERMSGVLSNLGAWATLHEDYAAAQTYFDESLKIAKQMHSQFDLAGGWIERGRHYVLRQMWPQASLDFRKALKFSQAGPYLDLMADCEFGLAKVAHGQGQCAQARELAERSLARFEAIPHPEADAVRAWLKALPC